MTGPVVEIVDRAAVIPLRWAVLRPGRPIEAAHFSADDGPAVHLAARRDHGDLGPIVAIGSIYPEASPTESIEPAWRLRGMATDPEVRGQGYGAAILVGAMDLVADRGGRLLWCNARTSALGFYEHLGFVARGDEFETEVGPHVYMSRPL